MPLFMPDEELAALDSDAASMVAERADEYIRNQREKHLRILENLDLEYAKLWSSVEDHLAELEQSLLNQREKHLRILENLDLEYAKLWSSVEDHLAELEQSLARSQDLAKSSQAALADHKLASQAQKRQLMELLEEKDAEISEKKSTIKTINSYLDKMMSEELCTAKEENDKLRGEIESCKSQAEKKQRSLEAEIVALTERVSELANDCIQKSEQLATSAAVGKEDALVSASAEIASMRKECLLKNSQIEALNIQMSTLKNNLETGT